MKNAPLDHSVRLFLAASANLLKDEEIPEPKWDTTGLCKEFEVIGFAAPYCMVIRRSDGCRGTVMFRHEPRIYFDFKAYR